MTDTVALLRELRENPEAHDWRAKWLRVCEGTWEMLRNETATKDTISSFLEVLSLPEKFSIARLVVPEFRSAHYADLSASQKRVMDGTKELRLQVLHQEGITQTAYDDPQFAVEKRILQDAEMHRARVLYHHSGPYGDIDEEMRQWLDAFPGKRDQGHNQ